MGSYWDCSAKDPVDFSKITYHEYWKEMHFNSLSKYKEV